METITALLSSWRGLVILRVAIVFLYGLRPLINWLWWHPASGQINRERAEIHVLRRPAFQGVASPPERELLALAPDAFGIASFIAGGAFDAERSYVYHAAAVESDFLYGPQGWQLPLMFLQESIKTGVPTYELDMAEAKRWIGMYSPYDAVRVYGFDLIRTVEVADTVSEAMRARFLLVHKGSSKNLLIG